MRHQTRPFIVEVKQKRGTPKRSSSIWADVDLSAYASDGDTAAASAELSDNESVDSAVAPPDAGEAQVSQSENQMADPQENQTSANSADTTEPVVPEAKKKTTRPKKAKAEAEQSTRRKAAKPASEVVETSTSPARTTRKVHSPAERSQKLAAIDKSIQGGATMKAAVAQAGISEQTYYQWKKGATHTPDSGDLKDLLALEEENKRLKALLADRLHKENAELKKKLGLA